MKGSSDDGRSRCGGVRGRQPPSIRWILLCNMRSYCRYHECYLLVGQAVRRGGFRGGSPRQILRWILHQSAVCAHTVDITNATTQTAKREVRRGVRGAAAPINFCLGYSNCCMRSYCRYLSATTQTAKKRVRRGGFRTAPINSVFIYIFNLSDY
jgi:hypothetical protein